MSDRKREPAQSAGLSSLVRREFKSEDNRKFLRALPAFRAEPDLPDRLRHLLARLEQAEQAQS